MPNIEPVADLLRAASRPFEDARAMPPGVYTSDAFLRRELETVFGREWICVGRTASLKSPGDYMAYDLAGQPIVVLRDREGGLRAMSNVCLHRMSTLLEGSGNTRSIVCPYHAWTYNLDGTLRAAPFMKETTGFDREDYALPQIRCEEWLGWIYVTLESRASWRRREAAPARFYDLPVRDGELRRMLP